MKHEKLMFICECHSPEHQMTFWYDQEYKELYTETHLITYRNIFKRIWISIKYIFGYKCQYGNWDNFIFTLEGIKKLRKYLNDKYLLDDMLLLHNTKNQKT